MRIKVSKIKAVILDIDDTIVSFCKHLLTIHNNLNKVKYSMADLKEWDLPSDLNDTFNEYEELLYASQPIIKAARKKIKKLRESGYRIILMTARDVSFRKVTEFNLALNDIGYDELYFNKNKSLKINRFSKEYEILLFADDKVTTVNKVKRNTTIPNVFLIGMPSNKDSKIEKGVIRVNDIGGIYVG